MTELREYQPTAEMAAPMSAWLVTIKVPKDPHHDPRNKQTGMCPVTMKTCTDVTGEHHTIMVVGSTVQAVTNQVHGLGYEHITRIEEV